MIKIDFMIRDFSKYVRKLYSKDSSTEKQMEMSLAMIQKPEKNPERFKRDGPPMFMP
ncbi:MAG: hypothetical protein GY737_11165 [Desulfobacteraceae bacterium]|nr:hypothetical protein [Desulfobacteraceae bacterium]